MLNRNLRIGGVACKLSDNEMSSSVDTVDQFRWQSKQTSDRFTTGLLDSQFIIIMRQYAHAILPPSVRPSRSCIVLNRLDITSKFCLTYCQNSSPHGSPIILVLWVSNIFAKFLKTTLKLLCFSFTHKLHITIGQMLVACQKRRRQLAKCVSGVP